jgi:hypothetical protein
VSGPAQCDVPTAVTESVGRPHAPCCCAQARPPLHPGRRRRPQGEPARQRSHTRCSASMLYVAFWLRTAATGQSPMREGRRTRCSSVAASAVRAEATPHPSRHLRTLTLSLRIPRAKARGAWEPGRHTAKAAKHLPTCIIGGGRDPHAQWERLDQPLVRLHIQRTSAGQHLSACVLALVPSHCRLQTTGAEPAFRASPNHQNVRIYRRARPVCLASHCVQRLMAVPTRNSEGLLRRSASVLCFADHCEGSRVVCAPGLDGIRGGGGRRLPSG